MNTLHIEYYKDNKLIEINHKLNDLSFSNDEIVIKCQFKDDSIKIDLAFLSEVIFKCAYIKYPFVLNDEEKIFFNGYNCWTLSKECTKNTYNKSTHKIPFKFLTIPLLSLDRYADEHIKPYPNKIGYNRSWSYMYVRNNSDYKLIASLSEKEGFTYFEYDKDVDYLLIQKDIEEYKTNQSFRLFDLVILNGNEDEVFNKWFRLMKINKPQAKPLTGYTSWYNYYQNINEKIILRDLDALGNVKESDIFQIDDGWESYVGDWLDTDIEKFPNDLYPIINKIHDNGMLAGIWLSPFIAEKKSKIYKYHQDWFIKDKNRKPFSCGCNWSGYYALDIYNHEVRKYIESVFYKIFNKYKIDLVKLDFLYAACACQRNDKTRGQVMQEAMEWLRHLCRGKLIIGCGVPLFSAFGNVDYCRIGCDVTLDYNDKFYMRLVQPERPSTKHAMLDTIYHRQLNNRAFLNDPDVFILRKENTKLTDKQKYDLGAINALFGSILFVSDNIANYDFYQKEMYYRILNLRDKDKTIEYDGKNVTISFEDDGPQMIVINGGK